MSNALPCSPDIASARRDRRALPPMLLSGMLMLIPLFTVVNMIRTAHPPPPKPIHLHFSSAPSLDADDYERPPYVTQIR
jgi:hypothetical protein